MSRKTNVGAKWLVFFAMVMIGNVAYADCQLNGRSYGTGSVVGGKTCQPDGSWK